MLVQQEKENAYFNFVNSINSDVTRKTYEYCMSRFLKYCNLDLDSLLKLSQQELSNLIIKYLVSLKISSQYKVVIMATIKHACEMNDIILNWKKLKKFIKSEKTDNEINGKDRGYTHEEIQKILEFSDQRLKTAFLVLASTGIRIGALQSIKIGDLEKFDDLYRVIIYRGDKEEYITFVTPESAKEIDTYLEFRKRRGETITQDSYLLVRKFSEKTKVKGKPFKGRALWAILEDCIANSGLRTVDHKNPFKRKQIPIFHGFRKFFTKQLIDSKLDLVHVELLHGHDIGLTGKYYKPTEQEMSALLGLLVRRVIYVLEKGISYSDTIEQNYEKYMRSSKPIRSFAEIAIGKDNDADANVKIDEMYDAYTEFCDYYKLSKETDFAFSRILGKLGFKKKKVRVGKRSHWAWVSVKLVDWKNETEDDNNEDQEEQEQEEGLKPFE